MFQAEIDIAQRCVAQSEQVMPRTCPFCSIMAYTVCRSLSRSVLLPNSVLLSHSVLLSRLVTRIFFDRRRSNHRNPKFLSERRIKIAQATQYPPEILEHRNMLALLPEPGEYHWKCLLAQALFVQNVSWSRMACVNGWDHWAIPTPSVATLSAPLVTRDPHIHGMLVGVVPLSFEWNVAIPIAGTSWWKLQYSLPNYGQAGWTRKAYASPRPTLIVGVQLLREVSPY